jgi:hypothetical protein
MPEIRFKKSSSHLLQHLDFVPRRDDLWWSRRFRLPTPAVAGALVAAKAALCGRFPTVPDLPDPLSVGPARISER